MRGLGESLLPMIVTLLGACGFRILWVYTVFPLSPTLWVLFLSYPISWAITFGVHCILFCFVRRRAYRVPAAAGHGYDNAPAEE